MSDRVDYLYEPEGAELHWDGPKPTQQAQQHSGGIPSASLSGPSMVHPADRSGMQNTVAAVAAPPRTRKPTEDELMAQAMLMLEKQNAQRAMLASPSIKERDASGQQLPQWLTEAVQR